MSQDFQSAAAWNDFVTTYPPLDKDIVEHDCLRARYA